jgi:hypothetical protein
MYLHDELLVPGGGQSVVQALAAPRKHARRGVDVNGGSCQTLQ